MELTLCFIGLHEWDKWGTHRTKDCTVFQARECKTCGKKQHKDAKGDAHEWEEWSEPQTTKVYDSSVYDPEKAIPLYILLKQVRTCSHCGMVDTRSRRT